MTRATDVHVGSLRIRHERIRLCLFLLPVWLLGAGELARFAWNSAVPGPFERTGAVKGRDFVQFYVAGRLAREQAWQALYDVEELQGAVARIVPAAAGQVPAPVYAPQVALFFAPWSTLSYTAARWWWCAVSALLYMSGALVLMRSVASLSGHRTLAWITVVCNPLFAMLLSSGQTGGFATLAWACAALAFCTDRPLLFGMSLGLLAYKPPLLVGVILPLAVLGSGAALAGLALMATGQFVVGLLLGGVDAMWLYIDAFARLPDHYFLTDTVPHHKQSFSGFFQLLIGHGFASAVLSAAAAAVVLWLWWLHRRAHPTVWMVPMLAATSVLLSPHAYVYDLVVLIPALLVATQAVLRGAERVRYPALVWAGYSLLFAPYSAAFAVPSTLQLSTVALTAFLVLVHRCWSRESTSGIVPPRLVPT